MSICVGNVRLALARSIQGWCGPTGASRGSHSAKVPYGVKQSAGYKESRLQRRLALEAARKQREARGLILDTRSSLFMCLRHNTGINWFRAQEILKHLEMHVRHPSDGIDASLRDKITAAANLVKAKSRQ